MAEATQLDEALDQPLCPHCLAEISPRDHFCPKCNGPISSHALIDPLGSIYATAHGYSNAMRGRPRWIVLIGVWLLLGPSFLVLVLIPWSTLQGGPRHVSNYQYPNAANVQIVPLGSPPRTPLVRIARIIHVLVLASIHTAILAVVTYRFVAYREPAEESPPEFEDLPPEDAT